MGKGKDYELDIKNAIMEDTTDEVVALRPDFSGNSLHSIADVIIIWPEHRSQGREDEIRGAFVEMKKRSGQAGYRIRVMEGSSKGESGLDELDGLVDGTPPWGQAWLMVKFDHREAIIAAANELLWELENYDGETQDPVFHGARLTPADSISMTKPELDDWESATAGREDHRKLLDVVGVPDEYIDSTEFDIEVETSQKAEA